MREMASAPSNTLEESFPLLESAESTNVPGGDGASGSLQIFDGNSSSEMSSASAKGLVGDSNLMTGSDLDLAAGTAVLGKKVVADDLTLVEGVGPKIAELIQANGIETWNDLSLTGVGRLREILDSAGPQFQVHDPSTWPEQAALLATGRWEEFKELTDRLDGGVLKSSSGSSRPVELDLDAAAAEIGKPVSLDDLTLVEGIGPKIAEILAMNGISTWSALSKTDPDTVKGLLESVGPQYAVHDPSTWPQQAGLLASGQWAKFKQLTDLLDGGVMPS
jgi:predicted flap endonuclease-1-like 5' DNA nuclease